MEVVVADAPLLVTGGKLWGMVLKEHELLVIKKKR